MNNQWVSCQNLCLSYGETRALDNLSIGIERQEIFGLIGPDGAGKTSLIRILASLLLPDSGEANAMGYDIRKDYREIRRSIGYMPGRFSLYHDLSVEENLRFYASVFGVNLKDNYSLIEDIYKPLEPFRKRRAGKLSGGMKQKLALACALIHKPGFLMLDEPTTGVDAVSRKEFWDHLHLLQDQGMTILVSTPYMDEAQRCDRLGLIQKGKLLDSGTPEEVRQRFEGKLFSLSCPDRFLCLTILRKLPEVKSVYVFGQELHVTFQPGFESDRVVPKLADSGISGLSIRETQPGIEDCFIQKMTAS